MIVRVRTPTGFVDGVRNILDPDHPNRVSLAHGRAALAVARPRAATVRCGIAPHRPRRTGVRARTRVRLNLSRLQRKRAMRQFVTE